MTVVWGEIGSGMNKPLVAPRRVPNCLFRLLLNGGVEAWCMPMKV